MAASRERRLPVHIPDLAAHEVYRAGDAAAVAYVKSGFRTSLLLPMLRNDELIGLLAIGRQRLEHLVGEGPFARSG
jgi:GAF domain-containing protein